jgi:hypothetical protein
VIATLPPVDAVPLRGVQPVSTCDSYSPAMDALPTPPEPDPAETAERADLADSADSADPAVVVGYDVETVDDFIAAVAVEQARLESVIEDALARRGRATTLLGMHETMVATMFDAYRDVTARRRDAEATASAIVRDGERSSAEILRAASRA